MAWNGQALLFVDDIKRALENKKPITWKELEFQAYWIRAQALLLSYVSNYLDQMTEVRKSCNHPTVFRTYSSKRILSSWAGQWRVDIVDLDGNVLKSLDFTVGEEMQPEASPPEETGEEKTGATE